MIHWKSILYGGVVALLIPIYTYGWTASHTASPVSATVGDVITYTISTTSTSTHPPVTIDPKHFEPFVIRTQTTAITANTQQHVWELSAFQTGGITIPELSLTYDGKTITLDPITIRIQSVLSPTDNTQKKSPNTPAMSIAPPWLEWGILIGTLTALLAGLGYWAWRQSQQQKLYQNNQQHRMKDPIAIAQKSITKLMHQNLIQSKQYQAHYTALSAIIRLCLARQLNAPLVECTSTELTHYLLVHNYPPELRRSISEFLHLSDPIKFANATPNPDDHHKIDASVNTILATLKKLHIVQEAPLS